MQFWIFDGLIEQGYSELQFGLSAYSEFYLDRVIKEIERAARMRGPYAGYLNNTSVADGRHRRLAAQRLKKP